MKTLAFAAALAAFALPATAGDMSTDKTMPAIAIEDAYARASGPTARAGAAFMAITNASDTDDRLIAVASDVSERTELHTHLEDANGVMRMIEVEDGFAIPAGGTHMLKRGGDHLMFMGLRQPFEHGEAITVTLTFENAGDMTLEIPIDLERMDHGGHGSHGAMSN
ncbi:MAG: copper chaperone PCu(A)C [Paracoccaceae bacterium]|nr:copper chaperone PCu(A)C [Paracoccaceae bacterium]